MYYIKPEIFFSLFLVCVVVELITNRTKRCLLRCICSCMSMLMIFAMWCMDNNYSDAFILIAVLINTFIILFLVDDPKKKERHI